MDKFFGGDSDSDSSDEESGGGGDDLISRSIKHQVNKTQQKFSSKKLAGGGELADLLDYDKFYESQQQKKAQVEKQRAEENAKKKQSIYIPLLKKNSDMRNKEYVAMREKKIQRELEAEKKKLETVQVFVTSGYKKKLQEEEKWKREKEEGKAEVKDVNESGMFGFYSNMSRFTENKPSDFEIEKRPKKKETKKVIKPMEMETETAERPEKKVPEEAGNSEERVVKKRKLDVEQKPIELEPPKKKAKVEKVEEVKKDEKPDEKAVLSAKERYLLRVAERKRKEAEAAKKVVKTFSL